MSSTRGQVDLVGHIVLPSRALLPGAVAPNNIIVRSPKEAADAWIASASARIGEWRANLRSTYIRWALAINGLEVAANRYDDSAFHDKEFLVHSISADSPKVVIAAWDGSTAAKAHRSTMPMLAAFGVIDMYAGLEEALFDFYRVFLSQHQGLILQGEEFKDLRRLRRDAASSAEATAAWEAAWSARLDAWQRRRLYDGLGKVFRAFCAQAGLKEPSIYRHTTVDTWAEVIDGIAYLRNALVHGSKTVPKELAEFSQKPYATTFDFEEGSPLVVTLLHLQGVQLFCEQLLTGLNLSMVEKGLGPLPQSPKSSE